MAFHLHASITGGTALGTIEQTLTLRRAVISAALFVALIVALPREDPVDNSGSIDYMGALLGLSALVLFNFAWK